MHHKTTFIGAALLAALACGACGGSKPYQHIETVTGTVGRIGDAIVTGAFSVAPRGFTPYTFAVPANSTNLRLEGTFTAAGGANNDIEVVLLEQSQFLNWQNGHKFTVKYESGRVTADRLSIQLPADPLTYVMVFSNRFSWFSPKDVHADLKLQYDRSTR